LAAKILYFLVMKIFTTKDRKIFHDICDIYKAIELFT